MNRITKYEPNDKSMFPYQLKDEELSTELDSIHKLGKIEDIEEDLEVDLITIFNALKNGIWYKLQNGELRYMQVALEFAREGWVLLEVYPRPTNVAIQLYNYMQKYGEVWALTKGELL